MNLGLSPWLWGTLCSGRCFPSQGTPGTGPAFDPYLLAPSRARQLEEELRTMDQALKSLMASEEEVVTSLDLSGVRDFKSYQFLLRIKGNFVLRVSY